MKKLTPILLLTLLFSSMSSADLFDMENIPEHEKLLMAHKYKGIDLDHPGKSPYSERYLAGESIVSAVYETYFTGDGPARHLESVIMGKAHNGYTIKYFFKFKPGKKLALTYYEKTVYLPGGAKIRDEAYDFRKSLPPLPADMTHPFTFHLIVRGLDFASGGAHKFHVWFSPTQVFNMKLVVKGEEEVAVPAGVFHCYHLEMAPDMVDFAGPIMGRAIKPLLANYQIWVDKEPPHRMVKYQGPFGLINLAGGPSEIYELAAIMD